MKTYELSYIISPLLTTEEAATTAKDVETIIQNEGGIIVKSEKGSPQTLAYPINNQGSGYFSSVQFQAEEQVIGKMKEQLEKSSTLGSGQSKKVLRHLLMVKKPAKLLKERRTRKPMFMTDRDLSLQPTPGEPQKKTDLNPADIDKKLDEILSE